MFESRSGALTDDLDQLAVRALDEAEARAELVRRLLPVLRRWARSYAGRGVDADDLTQDAVLGVLRATTGFDPSRGPFLAWAKLWARQALQQAVAERARPFRLPTHALWDLHELKQARERLAQATGSEPSLQQLADTLGWGVDRVGDVVRAERAEVGDAGMDLVADPLAEDAFEAVIDHVAGVQTAPLLLRLTEQERSVVAARADGDSLRSIGRKLGLSGERVRKIEARARTKIAAVTDTVDTTHLLVTSTDEASTNDERRNLR
ncbi:MAG TPA: sigma-70 family RNA polymerase sigma factor [Gaiellales bacterium]|nr:sigma-70 family RNA polymerase sigma factor [Gaiellales bacterium]